VRALTDLEGSHQIFLTRIARVEVIAPVTRRGRAGVIAAPAASALVAQFRHDAAHQHNILEVTPALLADAERLTEADGLRGYGAVQLAVSAELNRLRLAAGLSRLTLISADQELNTAAAADSLAVDGPNLHP
jgi:predicted nucleic acid-binding protein